MAKREISNLELKIKLTNEYSRNGGVENIPDVELPKDSSIRELAAMLEDTLNNTNKLYDISIIQRH